MVQLRDERRDRRRVPAFAREGDLGRNRALKKALDLTTVEVAPGVARIDDARNPVGRNAEAHHRRQHLLGPAHAEQRRLDDEHEAGRAHDERPDRRGKRLGCIDDDRGVGRKLRERRLDGVFPDRETVLVGARQLEQRQAARACRRGRPGEPIRVQLLGDVERNRVAAAAGEVSIDEDSSARRAQVVRQFESDGGRAAATLPAADDEEAPAQRLPCGFVTKRSPSRIGTE